MGKEKRMMMKPQFVFDLYTPKKKAYSTAIKCNYPGCNCKAINSHVMQKSRYVKSIAENGNLFMLLSTKQAMSLPIYCEDRQHDQKLFQAIEQKEMNLDSFLRLSYRAYCAARA